MAVNIYGDNRTLNAELYKALSQGEDGKVSEICRDLPNGGLHILTIHDDTVLHVASYHKRNKLVLELLSRVPETLYEYLTWQNTSGNTILHKAAANNGTIEGAREMLLMAPSLFTMNNNRGETALFRAARYGKTKIFKFLNDHLCDTQVDLRSFLVRNDQATILHVAVLSENFYLAYYIATRYPSLVDEVDGDGMTGLHLLACNPSAFDEGVEDNFFKWVVYKLIDSSIEEKKAYRVPVLKKIHKRKHRCESAKELARLLIKRDTSWEDTELRSNQNRTKLHKYGGSTSTADKKKAVPDVRVPDTPLLLATKSGCTEIVKEILEVYPQAVEHIDRDKRNILHVAIKYRRNEIIETVLNMKYPLARLRGRIDKKGHSILHMVGFKGEDQKADEDIRSPALVLRDDLLLFERVRSVCTTSASLQVNFNRKTAAQLFAENNSQLRVDAKEWMKSTAEHSSIVAVLIATVAFAAAYTVPGGPDQDTGSPLLLNKPLFVIFTIADALSLTLALTSVILFLSILTSSFRLKDFRDSLPRKLLLGLTVLILSVSMMMVAFAATLILTISSDKKWKNIMNVALYVISFFPVTVFVFSYVRLYKSLFKAFEQLVKKMIASVWPKHDV